MNELLHKDTISPFRIIRFIVKVHLTVYYTESLIYLLKVAALYMNEIYVIIYIPTP